MSDYRMDIKGHIGLSDYSNISDYLGVVDKNDKFVITIKDSGNNEIHLINSILRDNNFHISEEGYDENGLYKISACKY